MGVVLHIRQNIKAVLNKLKNMCRRDLATRKVVSYGEGLKEEGSDGSSVISYNSIASLFPCHRILSEQTSYIWNHFHPTRYISCYERPLQFPVWTRVLVNVLILMGRKTNLNQETS